MGQRAWSVETRRSRFMARLKLAEGGCIEWQGYRQKSGHGQVQGLDGRVTGAHRLAYIFAYGPIPDDEVVRHRCDNPPCCTPSHLILGTQDDNWQDMRERGRQRGAVGTAHPKAKLDDVDVARIRALRDLGVRVVDLAKVYGLTPGAVSHIVTRRTWKHVP